MGVTGSLGEISMYLAPAIFLSPLPIGKRAAGSIAGHEA